MSQQPGILDTELFAANFCRFIERAIKNYIKTTPLNHLTAFNNAPIVGDPIVGFADGDDPIFQELKSIIGEFHLTPREIMEKYIAAKRWRFGGPKSLEKIGVASWALPLTHETCLEERRAPFGGSPRYNHSRWIGVRLYRCLEQHIASLLEILHCHAVVPTQSEFFKIEQMSGGWMAANWSERHIAYACGLGTFGLNGLMITERGCAVYLSSVVCNCELTPTPRPASHVENCPFYTDGSCALCIKRCPGSAIDATGRSNIACLKNLRDQQAEQIISLGLDKGLVGPAPACGCCSTGVPCERKIPSVAYKRS